MFQVEIVAHFLRFPFLSLVKYGYVYRQPEKFHAWCSNTEPSDQEAEALITALKHHARSWDKNAMNAMNVI